MFAIDTETTGVDFHHGAKPYLVTACDDQGCVNYWEWAVNPYNREPIIPKNELEEIRQLLKVCSGWSKFDEATRERHAVIGHNLKFDAHALDTIGITELPWDMHHDTLTMAHVLGSNQPKDLTSLAATWLMENIQPYEDRMKTAVVECRRKVQQAQLKIKRLKKKGLKESSLFKDEPLGLWAIAKDDRDDMPSVQGSSNKSPEEQAWKMDAWLPRAMALHLGYPDDHWYWTVTRDYANIDSTVTMLLWPVLKKECEKRGLWSIYLEMRKLNRILKEMEDVGVTFNLCRADEQRARYEEDCRRAEEVCVSLSGGLLTSLPKGSTSKALRATVFEHLGLESSRRTKNDNDSMDKFQLEEWVQTLPDGPGKTFVENLQRFRKKQTALGYDDAYRRYCLPLKDTGEEASEYVVLYGSVNATGTDTLRMSMKHPNLQQVSKQELAGEQKGRNARYAFGPRPGREWWKADYENIELKIPGYESGEPAMVQLFERPKDPPYFGSYHLLNASIAYPDLFNQAVCPKCYGIGCRDEAGKKMPCQQRSAWLPMCEIKGAFKTVYEATWYQWIKNAGFALIYGCQEKKFDQTAHKGGAYKLLRQRLPKLFELSDKWLHFANKHGYIETMPDRHVNPKRGYPLLTSRTERGSVSPTVPLNYHVSGTAMWCTRKAMIRCEEQLREWRAKGFDGYMILQVHDELVFDFPKHGDPVKEMGEKGLFRTSNLWRARKLRDLMQESGNDIGIPLTVALSYCPHSWSEGIAA